VTRDLRLQAQVKAVCTHRPTSPTAPSPAISTTHYRKIAGAAGERLHVLPKPPVRSTAHATR
jgi:hypothetical protein